MTNPRTPIDKASTRPGEISVVGRDVNTYWYSKNDYNTHYIWVESTSKQYFGPCSKARFYTPGTILPCKVICDKYYQCIRKNNINDCYWQPIDNIEKKTKIKSFYSIEFKPFIETLN